MPLGRAALAAVILCAAGGFALESALWDGTAGLRPGGSAPVPALVVTALAAVVAGAAAAVRPALGFGVAAALSTIIALLAPAWEPFTGLLLGLFLLARTSARGPALLALAAAAVPLGLNAWNSTAWTGPVTADRLLPVLALWWGVAAAVWAVARASARSATRVRHLEASLAEARQAARIAERRAVARDLHDIVAHSLAGIVLQAGGARALTAAAGGRTDPVGPRVDTALERIEQGAHQALRELHRLLVTLRSADAAETADGGERLGGLADLDALVDDARADGLTVTVERSGSPRRLDRSLDLAAHRFLQESLANAMKHAGAGAEIGLGIAWGEDLTLTASCRAAPGVTPPRLPGGLGLVGLAERLAAVGGGLEFGPDGDRFVTTARLPAPAAAPVTGPQSPPEASG